MNHSVLLASTIGSFPKPEYLTKARAWCAKGSLGEIELSALEERATRETWPSRKSSASTCWSTARCTAATWSRTSRRAGRLRVARAGPLLRQPLLPQADHRRPDGAGRADHRRLVALRAVADREAREGHAHRSVHGDGLVLQRALRDRRDAVLALREAIHEEALRLDRQAPSSRSTSRRCRRAGRARSRDRGDGWSPRASAADPDPTSATAASTDLPRDAPTSRSTTSTSQSPTPAPPPEALRARSVHQGHRPRRHRRALAARSNPSTSCATAVEKTLALPRTEENQSRIIPRLRPEDAHLGRVARQAGQHGRGDGPGERANRRTRLIERIAPYTLTNRACPARWPNWSRSRSAWPGAARNRPPNSRVARRRNAGARLPAPPKRA